MHIYLESNKFRAQDSSNLVPSSKVCFATSSICFLTPRRDDTIALFVNLHEK